MPNDLASALYPSPSGPATTAIGVAPGHAGTPAAPPAAPTTNQPAPATPSLGSAIYGSAPREAPFGPVGRNEGTAWRGEKLDALPVAASVPASPKPAADVSKLDTPVATDAPTPTPDTPDAPEFDPAEVAAFADKAVVLGVNERNQQELLKLHAEHVGKLQTAAVERHAEMAAGWATQARAEIPEHVLTDTAARFNQALGNDADATEFRRLLAWSGVGNSPAAIRSIAKLLGTRR